MIAKTANQTLQTLLCALGLVLSAHPVFAQTPNPNCTLTLEGKSSLDPLSENLADWSLSHIRGIANTWGVVYAKSSRYPKRIAGIYYVEADHVVINYRGDLPEERKLVDQMVIAQTKTKKIIDLNDPSIPKLFGTDAQLEVMQSSHDDFFGQLTVHDQNEHRHGLALYYLEEDGLTKIDYQFGTSLEAKEQIDSWILKNTKTTELEDITRYSVWGNRVMESSAVRSAP
jgi:hypothetical protein